MEGAVRHQDISLHLVWQQLSLVAPALVGYYLMVMAVGARSAPLLLLSCRKMAVPPLIGL